MVPPRPYPGTYQAIHQLWPDLFRPRSCAQGMGTAECRTEARRASAP
jgi:hypothetical protein